MELVDEIALLVVTACGVSKIIHQAIGFYLVELQRPEIEKANMV